VVKSHGGASAYGFGNAIRVAGDLARSDYMTKVSANLKRMTTVLEEDDAGSASGTGVEAVQ
jgi:phosphate acyltransferase